MLSQLYGSFLTVSSHWIDSWFLLVFMTIIPTGNEYLMKIIQKLHNATSQKPATTIPAGEATFPSCDIT